MKYIFNNQVFYNRLKEQGFKSISDFARSSGVHRNTLFNYLKNRRSPLSTSLIDISATLNISPLKLIKKEDDSLLSHTVKLVTEALTASLNNLKAALVLFGSRARETQTKFSDIDFGITGGEKPIESFNYLKIKRYLDDQVEDLSISVDFVNLDYAPPSFLIEISKDMKYIAGSEQSFVFLKGVVNGINKAG